MSWSSMMRLSGILVAISSSLFMEKMGIVESSLKTVSIVSWSSTMFVSLKSSDS